MKIVSKRTEKDYYDNGAVYGIDETKIYVRKREDIVISADDYNLDRYLFHNYWHHEEHKYQILGFCGKIYFLDNYSLKEDHDKWYRNPKDHILIDEENLDYKLVEVANEWTKLSYTKYKKVKRDKKKSKGWRDFDDSSLSKYRNNKKLHNIFIEHKTPVFIISPESKELTLIINPLLKDYGFFRIKDTIQTFQEIEMFLGSVLINNDTPEMPVGDDKTIASSKGYDKWSFRREPSKRKN